MLTEADMDDYFHQKFGERIGKGSLNGLSAFEKDYLKLEYQWHMECEEEAASPKNIEMITSRILLQQYHNRDYPETRTSTERIQEEYQQAGRNCMAKKERIFRGKMNAIYEKHLATRLPKISHTIQISPLVVRADSSFKHPNVVTIQRRIDLTGDIFGRSRHHENVTLPSCTENTSSQFDILRLYQIIILCYFVYVLFCQLPLGSINIFRFDQSSPRNENEISAPADVQESGPTKQVDSLDKQRETLDKMKNKIHTLQQVMKKELEIEASTRPTATQWGCAGESVRTQQDENRSECSFTYTDPEYYERDNGQEAHVEESLDAEYQGRSDYSDYLEFPSVPNSKAGEASAEQWHHDPEQTDEQNNSEQSHDNNDDPVVEYYEGGPEYGDWGNGQQEGHEEHDYHENQDGQEYYDDEEQGQYVFEENSNCYISEDNHSQGGYWDTCSPASEEQGEEYTEESQHDEDNSEARTSVESPDHGEDWADVSNSQDSETHGGVQDITFTY
ncbi:hypothetical protein PVAG01_00512 [Phlyctema vagabunda]|uniref:Uncharacterized protein n=1 Tax=Phlyctema vagabunda TaxID=108571 RepID=A0ABR4PUH1_9HELO